MQEVVLRRQLASLLTLLQNNHPIESIVFFPGEGAFSIISPTLQPKLHISLTGYLWHILPELKRANLLNFSLALTLASKISGKAFHQDKFIADPYISEEIKTRYLHYRIYLSLIGSNSERKAQLDNYLNEKEQLLLAYLPELCDNASKKVKFIKKREDEQKFFEALHSNDVNFSLQWAFNQRLIEQLKRPIKGDESKLKQFPEPRIAIRSLNENEKLHFNNENKCFIKLRRLDNKKPEEQDIAAFDEILRNIPKDKYLTEQQVEQAYEFMIALEKSNWMEWLYTSGRFSQKIKIRNLVETVFQQYLWVIKSMTEVKNFHRLQALMTKPFMKGYLYQEGSRLVALKEALNEIKSQQYNYDIRNRVDSLLRQLNDPDFFKDRIPFPSERQLHNGEVESILKESGENDIVLNNNNEFELVPPAKASSENRYQAFKKIITIFNEDEGLDTTGVNEKHISQYLRRLSEIFNHPKRPLLEEGKAEVDSFIRFLGRINYRRFVYWGNLRKEINSFLEKYIDFLYETYRNSYDGKRLNWSEVISAELKSKGSLEEQLFAIELLMRVAGTAKQKRNKKFYRELREALLSIEFSNIQSDWKSLLSFRGRRFLKQNIIRQRVFKRTKYEGIPQKTIVIQGKPRSNNSIYQHIFSESRMQHFRRKHYKEFGTIAGIIMAIGGSAFMVVSIAPMVGFFLAGIFGIASFIVNGYLFKGAVSKLVYDGFFKVNDYPIRNTGLKTGLSLFMVLTTIAALALGILTFSAIVALTSGTFGIGTAIVLGAVFGGVTWVANTALFANPLRELFAYFDKHGVMQALKNVQESFRQTFLSLDDCRFADEKKTTPSQFVNKKLLVHKVCRLGFQSIAVLIGTAAAIIATVAFVGMLRLGVIDFISQSHIMGAELGDNFANILVRIAAASAQLPLALSSAIRVFNQMGAYLGEKVSNIVLFLAAPREMPIKIAKGFGTIAKGFAKKTASFLGFTLALVTEPKEAVKPLLKSLWYGLVLKVAIVLNAIGSAFMSESGLPEAKNYTKHVNDPLVADLTYASNGLLAAAIPWNSLKDYSGSKKTTAEDAYHLAAHQHVFFSQKAPTPSATRKYGYAPLRGAG